MKRYAIISMRRDNADTIARYLPSNYKVLGRADRADGDEFGDFSPCVVIQGEDSAGWTLDSYVLPRLASGLIVAREIATTHPVIRQVVGSLPDFALDENNGEIASNRKFPAINETIARKRAIKQAGG